MAATCRIASRYRSPAKVRLMGSVSRLNISAPSSRSARLIIWLSADWEIYKFFDAAVMLPWRSTAKIHSPYRIFTATCIGLLIMPAL